MHGDDGRSIRSDDPSYDALVGLSDGDTAPLLKLLAECRSALHPLLLAELREIFSGTHPRLGVAQIAPRGRPRLSRISRAARDLKIVSTLSKMGGPPKNAIKDTARECGVSVREVQRAAERQSGKRLKRFMAAQAKRQ